MFAKFYGFDSRVYILGVGWFVTSAGFAMVIPFMTIYFFQELHMSMGAIGLFFGFSAILRTLPQPVAGELSDRLGRVPLMAWSQILRSFTFAGVAIAIAMGKGFWVIGSIIGLNYILGAFVHPAANAMVADLVKKEQRISAYAFLRIGGNLGWAIGPAAGGFIAQKSYATLFLCSGVMALLSGLFFMVFLRDVPIQSRSRQSDFNLKDIFNISKDKKLFEYCVISLILFLAVAQLIAALSVYSTDTIGITKQDLGILYLINGAMVVFLQYPISDALKKFRLTRQLALGAWIYTIGYFSVGFATSFICLIICMVVITLAEIIVSPPSVTIVANLSSPGYYGRYMGIFGMFQTLGWSLGPTLGGFLLDAFTYNQTYMWIVISCFSASAGILYMKFERKISASVNNGSKAEKGSVASA
ncbi:MAG: MFS transporter [candidate division Zixibacteria bacterium]